MPPIPDAVQCPPREIWLDFLRGDCGDDELDALGRHLDACPECLPLVNRLSGEVPEAELFSLLRESLSSDPDVNPIDYVAVVRDAVEREREEPPREEAARIETRTKGRLGRFLLREVIGDGGFGIVWRADDPRLEREVALKVPRGHDRLDAAALKRFEVEAHAAGQIFHPHVVPVLDAGDVDGVPYLLMELCKGPSLAEWLKERTELPPIKTAASIVVKLADAIDAAHGKGVLHRDIKPSNVLLFPDDTGDDPDFPFVPRLADFGLAKLSFGGGAESSNPSTQGGAGRGTPSYMAPEQISKAEGECDARTDVWGLGVLFYELLTGRVPFQGENAVEILEQIRKESPPAPSWLRRGVPRDLETICLKCLAKLPTRRYATAAELRDDLRRFSRGEPIKARPPRLPERAVAAAKRRPVGATLIVSAVLGFLVIGYMQVRYTRDMQLNLQELRTRDRLLNRRLYASEIGQVWRSIQAGRFIDARDRLDRLIPNPSDAHAEDPRGFEWRYLKALTERNPEIRRIQAHKGLVSSLVYSPDQRLMATAGAEDNLVKLWDANTDELVAVLAGHASDVNRLAFSPDGTTLASASDDKTIRLWDVVNRETRLVLDGGERMFHLSFSPDGEVLATAGRSKRVTLWDVKTGRIAKRFETEALLSCVGFGPTSRRLLLADEKLVFQLLNVSRPLDSKWVPSSYARIEMTVESRAVSHDFSPEGRSLAIGGDTGWLAIVDSITGETRKLVTPHRQRINCLDHLSDGTIVSGDDGGEIRVWNEQAESNVVARIPDERVCTLAVAPDGLVAAAGPSGVVRFLRPNRYLNRRTSLYHPYVFGSALISGTVAASWVAHVEAGGVVTLLDIPTGRKTSFGESGTPGVVTVSTDGRWCAVGQRGGAIQIWDIEERKLVSRLAPIKPCHDRRILGFSHDGGRILSLPYSVSGDYTLEVIEWKTGRMVAVLPHPKSINSAAFSPDDGTVIIASDGATRNAFLWDTATWKPRVELNGHRRQVNAAVLSPDGRTVATGGNDGTIRLWNVADGKPLATLHQESVWIRSLAFSPDGKTLISGNEAGTVTFWQVSTGQELFRVTDEHSTAVLNLVFVDGGRRFVSAAMRSDAVAELVFWDADMR